MGDGCRRVVPHGLPLSDSPIRDGEVQAKPPLTVRDVDMFVQQTHKRTLDHIKRVAEADGVQRMFEEHWIDIYTVRTVAKDFLVWHALYSVQS